MRKWILFIFLSTSYSSLLNSDVIFPFHCLSLHLEQYRLVSLEQEALKIDKTILSKIKEDASKLNDINSFIPKVLSNYTRDLYQIELGFGSVSYTLTLKDQYYKIVLTRLLQVSPKGEILLGRPQIKRYKINPDGQIPSQGSTASVLSSSLEAPSNVKHDKPITQPLDYDCRSEFTPGETFVDIQGVNDYFRTPKEILEQEGPDTSNNLHSLGQ